MKRYQNRLSELQEAESGIGRTAPGKGGIGWADARSSVGRLRLGGM